MYMDDAKSIEYRGSLQRACAVLARFGARQTSDTTAFAVLNAPVYVSVDIRRPMLDLYVQRGELTSRVEEAVCLGHFVQVCRISDRSEPRVLPAGIRQ